MSIELDKNQDVILYGCVYKNPYGKMCSRGRGGCYSIEGLAPTILSMSGGGNKPTILIRKYERSLDEKNSS